MTVEGVIQAKQALLQKWKSKTWGIMERSLNTEKSCKVISCGAIEEQARTLSSFPHFTVTFQSRDGLEILLLPKHPVLGC